MKETIKNNITLIGMAGVGKSYIGKHLADKIGYDYIKVDDLITLGAEKIGAAKHSLPDEKFMELEEKAALSLEGKKDCVFDTGGSVVYSEKAMDWLKNNSYVIYLRDKADNIKKRFDDRGEPHLIGIEGKTFDELLKERSALYEKYADLVIDVSEYKDLEEAKNNIIEAINFKAKNMITFDEFKKVEIKIGKVISAERVEGSEKLIKLEVDLGAETRQIIAGIGTVYSPEDLVGKEMPIVVNLEPRKLMGLESQGMILAADNNGEPVILYPEREVPSGSVVK